VSFLAKVEQFCATFIERSFAKTFPSDLEPAQIARKLVSTMEAQTTGDEGRLHAPGSYVVHVSPADFERLADRRDYLERAWAELLRKLAARVGIAFDDGEARVGMVSSERVPLGAITVEVQGAAADATFVLRMVKGVPPNGVYSIQEKTRIGRSEESEILLVDPSVSRTHAVVEIEAGGAVVRDLGSTNGTFVNGRRIDVARLGDGDELVFGNTKMRFESA
jgi:FHA domain-containing protein